jgi:hypothetical protein
MPHAMTAGDQFLEQISDQLAVQNELLGKLVGVLAPEPVAAPEPEVAPDNDPASKKPPVKKPASRRKVTGQ